MSFSNTSPITFPGLGIEVDPTDGFTVPGTDFVVKWYGVIIAVGVLLAVLYAMRRCKEFGLTGDDILNALIIALPAAILGARLYYVIFYETPWRDFFRIRQGGLAIYGGVIGSLLALSIYYLTSKKRREKMLPCFDISGIGLLIGQTIGRWGNFFNREAHGGETDCFLRMGLIENGKQIYVHPTFLYESVWNLVGFVLLHWLSKRRKFDGQVILYYVIWYGLGRAWIEGLRTDSLYWGSLRVSQILAMASCVLASALLLYILLRKRPSGEAMLVNREAAAQKAEDSPEE